MLTRSWGSCRTITTLIERTRNAEVRTRNRGGGFERRSRALDWPGGSAFRVPPSAFRLSSDQLQPVRVDVVRLVVEPERRGVGRAEAKLELGHIHREIQGRVVPSRVRQRGEIVGPAIRLLAAAILVLELEPQGLALVEAVRRAVEGRGVPDPQRRPESGSRP